MLIGRNIAVLATDSFEQIELTKPVKALKHQFYKRDGVLLRMLRPAPQRVPGS
jgi:hypothetical protein